jgi:hypothetical protein
MPTRIPFGEWLPDVPPFANPGATVAKNVLPAPGGYRSFPSLNIYSNSLGSVCKGAIVARDTTGNYFNYAGDQSALYALSATSWTNVGRSAGAGGAYNVATDDYWEFTQFGTQLIGVNGLNDAPQTITVGAAQFQNLGGSPPKAKHIASIRDFVVMGNISSGASYSPQMVRWCAINNAASWTADPTTLADFQDLPGDSGWVQKIVGGEYGTIFQERAIWRMTFVGSPLVFQFDRIHTNIGAFAPQSVIGYRNLIFFLAEQGFCMFDGSNVKQIGDGKVDRTFYADLDYSYVQRIQAAVDPFRKIVCWAYPGTGNIGGNPNRILVYNWTTDRWSRIEDVNLEFLFSNKTTATGLDSLDTLFSSIDSVVPSLDSSIWAGGVSIFSAFNNSHRLANFNGSAMAATVETNEQQLNPIDDGLTYITQIKPILDGVAANVQASVIARNLLTDSASSTIATSPVSAGFVQVRSSARYHRFRVQTLTATAFENLQGLDVTIQADGLR